MVVPAFVRVPGEQFQGFELLHGLGGARPARRVRRDGPDPPLRRPLRDARGHPGLRRDDERRPRAGDFEFGGIFKPTDPVQLRRKQNAELKNGRLAMLAFSGQVTQAVLTGHDAPFLYWMLDLNFLWPAGRVSPRARGSGV